LEGSKRGAEKGRTGGESKRGREKGRKGEREKGREGERESNEPNFVTARGEGDIVIVRAPARCPLAPHCRSRAQAALRAAFHSRV